MAKKKKTLTCVCERVAKGRKMKGLSHGRYGYRCNCSIPDGTRATKWDKITFYKKRTGKIWRE